MNNKLQFCIFLVAIIGLQPMVCGQSTSWTGGGGANNKFSNAVNWSNGVPTAGHTAIMGLPGTFEVFMNVDATIKELQRPDGALVLFGSNTLTVQLDAVIDHVLRLEDAGTTLHFNGDADLGTTNLQLNRLEITAGANVIFDGDLRASVNSGVDSSIAVAGTGANLACQELRVNAVNANGIVNVLSGGSIDSDLLLLGNSSNAVATAVVSGEDSVIDATVIQIAGNGLGTINLDNDGTLLATNINVGAGVLGDGVIEIDGGGVIDATNMRVGNNGDGSLTINDGKAMCQLGVIGASSTGIGTATVSSLAASLCCDELRVGDDGDGDLFIEEGAAVIVSGATSVNEVSRIIFNDAQNMTNAGKLTSVGPISVAGLMIFNSGVGTVNGNVELTGNSQLQVSNAGALINGNLDNNGFRVLVSPNGELTINGDWSGASEFVGVGQVNVLGKAKPGNSSAVIPFDGSVELGPNSELEIEIGGDGFGQFDRLEIGGDINLAGGELSVSFINGFQPAVGDEFEFVEYGGSLTGSFSNFADGDVVATIGNVELILKYVVDHIILVTGEASVLLGDVNLDGVVNLLDVAPFVDRIATNTFQPEADINMDGMVNLLDVAPFVSLLAGN